MSQFYELSCWTKGTLKCGVITSVRCLQWIIINYQKSKLVIGNSDFGDVATKTWLAIACNLLRQTNGSFSLIIEGHMWLENTLMRDVRNLFNHFLWATSIYTCCTFSSV